MKLSSESEIAIPTPHSTPSSATPANATIASTNSDRRQRLSLRAATMSISPITATITTAASADVGMSCTRSIPTTSSTPRMTAPVSPAIWLRAPTSSATAVRELLVESGNP